MRNGRVVLMNLRQIGRMGDAAQEVLSPLGELYNKQMLSREEFTEIAPDVDILVSGSSLSIGKDELVKRHGRVPSKRHKNGPTLR